MSSNQGRRGVESWSLRRRLIFEQIVLLALVCVVVVLVTEVALRAFLVGQLDDRLTAAKPPPGGPRPGNFIDVRSLGPGAFTALVGPDGQVAHASRFSPASGDEDLPASEYPALLDLPADDHIYVRDLGSSLGDYRLVARQTDFGVTITGLPMSEVDGTLLSAGLIMGGVALAGLLAAAGAGAFIVRRALHPLQRVAATASQVAELPLDQGEVELAERVPKRYTDPNTEVGQVGLAFNRMLGNVRDALVARHESETRVRQFVADVSHELRTPLAAVRGYTELIRRRDDDVTPEVAHALSRVESEAARMTTLVEDLLLLARLDSGRPLDRAPVDVSRLVVDMVSDAQVAGQSHVWQLDVPPDPVVVPGDDARLHQVVANLLSNSRTHTPPGTTVVVGLSTTDEWVVLTVTDNGPGIPSHLLPEVFERFARGDSSRSRAAGSTGLGLAIVAAVVQAHHGWVEVESRAGWTRFTVRLPRTTHSCECRGRHRNSRRCRGSRPVLTRTALTQASHTTVQAGCPSVDAMTLTVPNPTDREAIDPDGDHPVLDIVVPVFNEERDLAPCVRRPYAHLSGSFPYRFRITVANNASTDGTAGIADELARAIPEVVAVHLPEKGRGRALHAVWSASDASVLAYLDVDLSTDLNALTPLIAPLLSGHSDLAIGSRLARGARVVRGPKREFISRCYNLILRGALATRFSDAQCGFKAIRADVATKLLPHVADTAWFFDSELLVLAERAGLRIHEIPVDWIDDLDSRVDIIATALADLRGMALLGAGFARGSIQVPQLRGPGGRPARGLPLQIARFTVIGVASTIAYVALFLLFRLTMPAQAANVVSLLLTAVANHAASRRMTFGSSVRS